VIDRYYIEKFLNEHIRDVKGRVLEMGERTYTKQFGGDRADELWLDWSDLPDLPVEARLSQLCRWVLGADTIVVVGSDVLGKPDDPAHAVELLERLLGREHRVITGVALTSSAALAPLTTAVQSTVVMTHATREEVVDVVERYKISALPVVDIDNFLIGVVTYEDVVETIEDIADETIAQMAGTGEKVSEFEPMLKRFFARAPWLIATLCAGMVNGGVMSHFQKIEGGLLTFVLFFVPLIMGTSGNVGLQCSTVLVRGTLGAEHYSIYSLTGLRRKPKNNRCES